MSSQYEVKGSEECSKIKELALMQINLQAEVNRIANNPDLGVDAVEDSVQKVLTLYKDNVKRNYIFKQPMKAYAYFALFQTVTFGNSNVLIFNPSQQCRRREGIRCRRYQLGHILPKAERGVNLHNIAIEGMKDVRIIQSKQNEGDTCQQSGCIGHHRYRSAG